MFIIPLPTAHVKDVDGTLGWLQISQHQLQKNVTHRLSFVFIDRCDNECDFSDLIGVFFLTGSIGHSVLLSQFQTNANLSPLFVGETRKGGTRAGRRPFAFLHIGTICLEAKIRSAALIFLARHKTAILGATLLAGVVWQLRWTGCQPVHSRIVAVGWQVPTCGAGVDRSSSVLEKSWRTRRPAPRTMPGAAAIQLWRGSTPLIYQGHLEDVF